MDLDKTSTYLRNGDSALRYCRGLPIETAGILSMIIDIMAMHSQSAGIPCEPKAYIAGLIGVGTRKWTQTIEPTLINAKRIVKVEHDGIMVYQINEKYAQDGVGTIFTSVFMKPESTTAIESGKTKKKTDTWFATMPPTAEDDLYQVNGDDIQRPETVAEAEYLAQPVEPPAINMDCDDG